MTGLSLKEKPSGESTTSKEADLAKHEEMILQAKAILMKGPGLGQSEED